MVPVRFIIWVLLSGFTLAVAFALVAISRQIPSLDHGWINSFVILALWVGVAMSLRRALLSDTGAEPVALHHRVTASTLHARRS